MKVFCTNSEWIEKSWLYWLTKKWVDSIGPSYGDICTVTGSYYEDGELYYELLEWDSRIHEGFLAECFIPIQEEEADVSAQKEKVTN